MNNQYLEQSVTIESAYPLKGTLALPDTERKYPAVVMLHGSGPTDRNENVKGMEINAFKDFTDVILPLGIATLRYDKRGIGESGGDYYETGMWDLVDDAEAAIQFLKGHPNIDSDRILLLGHSEGAVLAPIINSRVPVQGMILLAGAAESVGDTILRQGELAANELNSMKGLNGKLIRLLKLPEKTLKKQKEHYEKIETSSDAVMKAQFQKINAKWIREHLKYNVVDDLAKVTCPTLAITGSKDIQVRPEDAKRIADTVAGEAEYHIIDNLTHILRRQESEPSIIKIKKDYKKLLQEPIDQELIQIITTWLEKHI